MLSVDASEKIPPILKECFKAGLAIKIISKIVLTDPGNTDEFKKNFEKLDMERRVTLRTEMGGRLKEIPAGFSRSVPGTTIMFLLFTVLMYGGINLLQERRLGQLA